MKKIAILDFDGTLNSGDMAIALLKYSLKAKILTKEMFSKILKLFKDFITGKISYIESSTKASDIFTDVMRGKTVEDINNHLESIFKIFKSRIYSSSHELIALLKEKGYHTMLLSTTPQEIISLAGKELGTDEAIGTTYETKKGMYTGRILTNFHHLNGKEEFIKKLKRLKKYDWNKSMLFGDSLHEANAFYLVEIPIALNPQKKVRKLAKEKGWIILNHQNVIKKLKQILS